MTRQLGSYGGGLGLVLAAALAVAPACAMEGEGSEEELGDELGEELVGEESSETFSSCPYLTSDPNQFHAKYVEAFNADNPPHIGCLYEFFATFIDPATGTAISGRPNIQNQVALYQTGTHMVATTRYAVEGGLNIALLSASFQIIDDASGTVIAAGQSADTIRLHLDGKWRLVVDHPFGGQ